MKSTMRWPASAWLISLTIVFSSCARKDSPESANRLTVFAAASTTDVVREAGRRYETATGIVVAMSFDASSNLARQIKAGAPADVYLSANQAWMDDVEAAGGIQSETRRDLLANDLVLIAPSGRGFEMRMTEDFDFAARLPEVRRIAVGDPAHVPAGRYARQALESLGWWDSLEPLLIPALDARAALRLVEIGEADAGIVYSTDAMRSDRIEVIAAFPSDRHEPIRYPVALCSDSAAGAAFIEFLGTEEMRQIFEAAGFRVLSTPHGGGG